jgi:hypothetical protein
MNFVFSKDPVGMAMQENVTDEWRTYAQKLEQQVRELQTCAAYLHSSRAAVIAQRDALYKALNDETPENKMAESWTLIDLGKEVFNKTTAGWRTEQFAIEPTMFPEIKREASRKHEAIPPYTAEDFKNRNKK